MPYSYAPYRAIKKSMGESTINRAAHASRRIGGQLRQQGTGDIPGVYSSAYGRLSRGASQDINRAGAEIDLAYQSEKTRYDQWEAEREWREKQYREAKDYRNRMDWINGIISVAGIAATIFAGPIAGGIVGATGKFIGNQIAGDQPSSIPPMQPFQYKKPQSAFYQ